MVGVWIWMLRGWSWAPERQICRNRSLEFPGGLAEPWNTCEEQPLHLQWNDEWKRIGRLWLQRKQFVFWMSATAKETAKAFPPSPGSVVFEFSLADAVLHGSVQWLQSLWLLSYVYKIKLAYFRPCSFHLCHKRPLGPLLSRKTLEKSLNIQQHNESSEVWFRLRIEVAFFLLVDSHSWSPESTRQNKASDLPTCTVLCLLPLVSLLVHKANSGHWIGNR